MNKVLNKVAGLVVKVANFGAGAVSIGGSYQPKTPKCLQGDKK